ncbi:MAG TPA: YHS domain-containing protein [Nitrospirae bacterium]|nr:YHS domain-containing protein [Nitrospirota bacterium]
MIEVKDPVCGMAIREKDGIFTSSYNGASYYFCSEKCKGDFDKAPDAVLAMKAAREKATEKERSVSLEKMIDAVAHEIRNPLTSIGGFARKIYKKLPQDDPNKEYIKLIIDDVARVENMVRQIVELKTMGASHPEPSNVNNIVNEVVKSFKKELGEREIEFKLELMDKPPLIFLDSNRVTTAIAHLIRNAVEAMEKTPRLLKISSLTRNEQVEITVSDTGKGIPEDKIKYIFDPLFTSKIYGPGLGLTFAKMIVQEHQGTISVESKQGKGAAITIRLPLKNI